ncbi:MAG: lactate racemase domain-containing protein [Promethearchaeia archaeon]
MNRLTLPKIRYTRQEFNMPFLQNIEQSVRSELTKCGLKEKIQPNHRVAITGSSRGIKDQALVLKTIVEYVKELNAEPFIFPAMGSHGGGTAEGQRQILADYGITETKMACPVKATMEVQTIGTSEFGTPINIDKYAAKADHIILVNSIKCHSKFVGEVESGLSKMALIGLGKHKGAQLYHRLIDEHSWPTVVSSIRKQILKEIPVICGVGIIQNADHGIAEVVALTPNKFASEEPQLFSKAKQLMAQIPFRKVDLLIVDEMGKEIFGTGMNSMITGRKPNSPNKVLWLFVRDLTKQTHGNAQGIGLADFTTKRLVEKIDFEQTYMNALTAFRTDSPKIPVFLDSDREVMKTIMKLKGKNQIKDLKLVWIKNTLELNKMLISEPFFERVQKRESLNFFSDPEYIQFNRDGFLINSQKYW